MEWHDAVMALKAKRFGWLTPGGDILPCELHDHFSAVKAAGEFSGEIAEFEAMTHEAIEADCQRLTDEVGSSNAEWHRLDNVDSLRDRARQALLTAMYSGGWVRLGTREAGRGPVLEAEGSPSGLRRAARNLGDLAICAGCELETRAVDREGVQVGGPRVGR